MGRTNYSYSSLLSAVIKTLYYRYASYDQNKSTLSDRVTEDAQSSTRRDYSLYPFLQEEYNVDAPQLETLDFIPPLITLIGQNPQILERYANYTDPGATTEYGSTIVSTDYSQVDPTTQGDYEVTYTASDGVNTTTGTRIVRVVDTVPPEASLIGDNPYILERYLDYVDPGLNLDQGSFIANIDTSQLNNTVPGDYTITYTVSDGTNEITLTRDITVVDTVSPVITLIGNDPYLHEMYTQYEDPGVALDRGSILTSMDTSQLDINTAGSYTVTYTATDGINTRTASRTVTVADTTSPVITLNGANPYYVARYTQYVDPHITLDEGSNWISTDTSQVDTFNPGSYSVVYTANDGFFTSTAIRTVIVKNPPVLTLSGPSQYYVQLGSTYTDPGATSDNGEEVTIDTSLLDMNTRGTYIVNYTATDITGISSSANRTVVVDAPVLTLSESDPYYVQLGSTYNDPGATSDNGEVVAVDVSNLDMNTRGSYTITYSATDNRGFIGTVTRTIIVDAPIITLVGSETYYVGVGTTYVDPGATSDGGETVTIDTSALDMATIGTYTVTYTATDSRGFIGTTTRNVVVDTNIITLIGENPYYVQLGSTFTDPGSTSENEEVITIDSSSVDTTTRGSYTVLHSAVKSNGALSFVSRIVIVDAPVISLIGSNPLYVARGTTYTDPGATSDGGETVTIDSSSVNMNLEDQYTVTYTAVDSRGFTETITRTVIVDDPVFISLRGYNPYMIGKGTNYVEYGAVSDNLEQVVIDTSTLDINTNGTYTVTYTATRENGIVGTATRTVIVDSPVITPTGDNPYYVQLGSTYTDPGATSDGGETVSVNTSNIVMNTRGSYTVTYSATDSNGFLGTATRTVVVDAPVITLGGTNPQYVLTGTPYSEFGGTSDGGETVTIDSSSIDVNTPASYNVSYTATDSNGFVETITREVVVKNAPVITLLGSNPYYVGNHTVPNSFSGYYTENTRIISPYADLEPGATSDGGETVTIDTGSLDMNTNGTYTVTYNTSNTISGLSSSITRTVIVEDPVLIAVIGIYPAYNYIGNSSDSGATSDAGNVTVDQSQVDYNTRGAYTVYYSATNTNGTVGRAFRTVYVREVGNLNPTITLTGDNPYYVQRGSTYTEPGATADILEAVSVDTSNVDMNTNGTYTITYTATDVNARSSTTTRTVIVSGPVISLASSDTLLLSRGTTYTDPGATSDGGETVTTDFGGLNTNINGVYTITYSAVNEMGFVGTATRTVTVGGPTITLQGPNPYYVGQGSLYYDPGAVSSSGEFVKINTSDIVIGSQGTFNITYTAIDSNTISNTITRTVIYDSRPGITLYGINPYYVQKDSVFTDPGSVSSSGDTITIDTSNVDMNTNGTYYVTHSFTDSLNRFCTMTRTVIVDSPVITLVGDNPQYVVNGTSYAESGATSDGDETVTIDSSSVDTTTNGTYTVTYTTTNRDGFVSTVSRTVIVTTPSVITLVGDNPYIVEKYSEYVDPGATSSGGETVTVDTSNLNMTKHLLQYVTYSVTNSDGYVTTLQRTVDVRSILFDQYGARMDLAHPYHPAGTGTFGESMSFSQDGSRIAIGSSESTDVAMGNGIVFVYERRTTNSGPLWNQLGSNINGTNTFTGFGSSVSLSNDGNYLAIGEYGSNAFYVYEWTTSGGGSWTQKGSTQYGEGVDDNFGRKVSISGDGTRVAATAIYNDGNGAQSGQARIYEWSGSDWYQIGQDIDGEVAGEFFGYSLSLSSDGNRVAIGSHRSYDITGAHYRSGRVAVYEWNSSTSTWDQMGSSLRGTNGEQFGHSISLSSDGSRLAIGINYSNNWTGKVQVYDWDSETSSWTQVGDDIDGVPGDSGEFGYSVSLSHDGTILAIGAIWGDSYGKGYVYKFIGGNWVSIGDTGDATTWTSQLGYSASVSGDGTHVAFGARDGYDAAGIYTSGNVLTYDIGLSRISLSGSNPYYILRGTSYTEPGVTHDDGYSITPVTSSLDENTNGTYNVSYTWLSDTVNRTVIVDSASLTLLGDNPYYVKPYYTYVDPGVTSDNGETVLVDTQYLNINIPGEYIVYYSVRRGDGYLLTTTRRTVIVKEPPVITLLDNDPVYLYRGMTYIDPGATSSEGNVTVNTNNLNTATPGQYKVYYTSGIGDSLRTIYRNVIVNETPVILLRGPNPYYISQGSLYNEYGFELLIPGTVTIDTSNVNADVLGTYTVKYSYGGTVVGRTVIVDGPIITVNGDNPLKLFLNEPYRDQGATADGGESVSFSLSTIDTSTSGVYYIVYSAINSRGNIGIARRTVIVTDTAFNLVGDHIEGVKSPYSGGPTYFGETVAISDNGLRVVYSSFTHANLDGSRGIVKVFSWDGSAWVEMSYGTQFGVLTETNFHSMSNTGFIYGWRLLMSTNGNRLAVANPTTQSGGVFIYKYSNNEWTTDTYKVWSYGTFGEFGRGLAWNDDANIIAVGGPSGNANLANVDGCVEVYGIDDSGVWTLKGSRLTLPSAISYTRGGAGDSVAMSSDGNIVAFGAPYYTDSYIDYNKGAAIVYSWDGTQWTQLGDILKGTYDQENFGRSIAISGDGTILAVGAPNNNGPNGNTPQTGAVCTYRYNYDTQIWDSIGVVYSPIRRPGNYFGYSISLDRSGTKLAVGSPFAESPAGARETGSIVAYEYINGNWEYRVYSLYGDDFDFMGSSVKMSSNGERIATGSSRRFDPVAGVPVGRMSIYDLPRYDYATDAVLVGNNPYYIETGTTYTDPGIVIADGETASIQTSNLNANIAGTYNVECLVLNQSGEVIRENTRTVIVEDPPVITLVGDNPYTVGRGTVYTELGATSNGGETVSIDTTTLDMNTNGIYTISYNVVSVRGYTTTKRRTISVEAPIIRLQGDNPFYTELNKPYVDPGATSEFGENVTVDDSEVNSNALGEYTVTYTSTDTKGFIGKSSRTVIVAEPPVITILGDNPYYVELNSIYTDPGATSNDGESVLTNTIEVNTSNIGYYDVHYRTKNQYNFVGLATRVVVLGAPFISLNGPSPYYIQLGGNYIEYGGVSSGGENVTIDSSNIDTNTLGVYKSTYTSTGSNGITRITSRYIYVEERVITLIGDDPYYVDRGSTYSDPGATSDGDGSITIDYSNVDMNTFGTYTVFYYTTDSNGISGTTSRTVIVDSPILTLQGNNPYYHGNGYVYVDPGVTSDGGETVEIDTTNLDVNTNGTYTVTYNVVDENGLPESITRTVIVENAPVITLNGSAVQYMAKGSNYSESGATSDGGETVSIDTSNINSEENGSYYVLYTASNANGTVGFISRTVVVDSPVITLIGDNPYYIRRDETYTDPGATSDGGEQVTDNSQSLNTSVLSRQVVTYSATDANGFIGTTTRVVYVIRPVATLDTVNYDAIYGEAADEMAGSTPPSFSKDGTRVAIAAPGYTNNNAGYRIGIVRIYDLSNGVWTKIGEIAGQSNNDEFGYAVSISGNGNRLAIGSPNRNSYAGYVRIYEWNGSNWSQMSNNIDGEHGGARLGTSVSMSYDGSSLIIGSPNFTNGNLSNCGRIYVYTWTGSSWNLIFQFTGTTSSSYTGMSVSMSDNGDAFSFGAPRDGSGTNGTVRVFEQYYNAWRSRVPLYGANRYAEFGFSAIISGDGNRLVVGAPSMAGFSGGLVDYSVGRIYVYDWNSLTNSWVQVGNDIVGPYEYSQIGRYLACPSDCSQIYTGIMSTVRASVSMDYRGRVQIYNYDSVNNTWGTEGNDILGENDRDYSFIVSLSGDGKKLGIGGFRKSDSNGPYNGYVRIFSVTAEDPTIELSGSNPYYIQLNSNYVEPGFISYGYNDILQSNTSNLDVTTRGSYVINYTATDQFATSSIGYANRTVVVDAPIITLNGNNPYYIGQGQTYTDPGATSDGGETVSIDQSNISTSTQGTYTVIFNATDNRGFSNVVERSVVVDSRSIITLSGSNPYYMARDAVYTDAGAVSSGGETVTIDESNLDTNTNGTYYVTYSATSANGDLITNYRVVVVNSPVLTIVGQNPLYIDLNDNYTEYGSISSGGENVTIDSSNVDTTTSGTYTVTYTATNVYGFSTTITRTVVVDVFRWYLLDTILDGEAVDDQFGHSISLSGDGTRVAIGGPTNDGNGTDAGHVRVYEWSGTSWTQMDTDIDGEAAGDKFGYSVSLSSDGTRVAIGAPLNDGNGAESGHVRVYEWSGTTWTQMDVDIDGEAAGDHFGHSVSLSSDGTRVAIGAPYNNGNGSSAGHVRVYDWDGSNWNRVDIDIDGESAGDLSGYSVSISGDGTHVVIGAPHNSDNGSQAGHFRVYRLVNNTWTKQGLDINGANAGDQFGHSVSISYNGSKLIAGSPYNSNNGTNSGSVSIFEWNSSTNNWSLVGSTIDGESSDDHCGWVVDITDDGSRVLLTSYKNDDRGLNSGHIRIYDLSNGNWNKLGDDLEGTGYESNFGFSGSISRNGSTVAGGSIISTDSHAGIFRYGISTAYSTLTGDNPYIVGINTTYVDPGVSVSYGILTVDASYINMTQSGTYYVVYYTKNTTTGRTTINLRQVNVVGPSLTLIGPNPLDVVQNGTYTELGATSDGGETVTINTGSLNVSTRGSYTITYSATDSSGYSASILRTVRVYSISISQYLQTIWGSANQRLGYYTLISGDGSRIVTLDSNDYFRIYTIVQNQWYLKTWGPYYSVPATPFNNQNIFPVFWSHSLSYDGNTHVCIWRKQDYSGPSPAFTTYIAFTYWDPLFNGYREGGVHSRLEFLSGSSPPSGLGMFTANLSADGNTFSTVEHYLNRILIFEKASANWASWTVTSFGNPAASGYGSWGYHVLSGDGNTMAVSNVYDTNVSTHTTDIYTKSSSNTWSLTSQIPNPSSTHTSSGPISLSEDGTKLTISATEYPYGGYTASGVIYFYKLSGGTWSKLSFEIGGDQDYVRPTASISGNGKTVIVWEANRSNLGRARVYVWPDDNTITKVGSDIWGVGSTYGYARGLAPPTRDGKFGITFELDDPSGGTSGYGSIRTYQQQIQY